MSILAWLIGTSFGRKVALTGLALMALGLVALKIYLAGQAAEKAKEAQRSIDALRKRISTDEEISNMSAADRRKRLNEWVSDN